MTDDHSVVVNGYRIGFGQSLERPKFRNQVGRPFLPPSVFERATAQAISEGFWPYRPYLVILFRCYSDPNPNFGKRFPRRKSRCVRPISLCPVHPTLAGDFP
jgi:hypothetical protein